MVLQKTFLISHSFDRYSEQQIKSDIYTNHYTDYTFKGDRGFQGGAGFDFPLGQARWFSLEVDYMQGSQVLENPDRNFSTKLKTKSICLMTRINF